MSRVDVIIPCYNYAAYLADCVESVLRQPIDVRVLIIDDASPDNTPEVAAELARDPRVEYRRHEVNQGHIATYNEGLAWCSGDYTVLLSADDVLTDGALLRAARLMDAHPTVGMVYGNVIQFRTGETPRPPSTDSPESSWKIVPGIEWIEERCRAANNCTFSPEVVVRTSLQHALGGYRYDLPYSGDFEMWLRFAAHSDVGILSSDQAYYRLHGRSMTDRSYTSKLPQLQQRKAALDELFTRYRRRLPEAGKFQRLAGGILARDALLEAYLAFYKADPAASTALADLAAESSPRVRFRPVYLRLRLMQRAGPRRWSNVRRALNRPAVPEWC